MSSSSSSSFGRKHEVFLSFRAKDTRRTFVSHLCRSLDQKGITTFRHDNEELERRPPIPPELTRAINDSRFAIVVLSENYADSVWCLEELVKITDSLENGSLTVTSVFYEVDPSDVERHLMEHHKNEAPEKVQTWNTAFTRLFNLSRAIHSLEWDDEAEMVNNITSDILEKSTASTSSDSDVPHVMDRHLRPLYELLDLESNSGVRKIGIWGMEGVGKTALARHLYGKISSHFELHAYLKSVRKISEDVGLRNLGDEIIKQIEKGSVMMSSFVHCKILLIADDVGSHEQCVEVNKVADSFGQGSRVIIITHDQSLLADTGIEHVYGVECLRYDESLRLFCNFAFKQTYPPLGFANLSVRAVFLSGFVPLALRILGSFLLGKQEDAWETALQRLEAIQDDGYMEVLKSSYLRARNQD